MKTNCPAVEIPRELRSVGIEPSDFQGRRAAHILPAHLEQARSPLLALSTRRVSGLMMVNRSTMNYRSRRDPQHALRVRTRELAASRVRFGYRRLTVLLRREGWAVRPHSALADHPPETFAARWAETAAPRPEPVPALAGKPATGNSLEPLT